VCNTTSTRQVNIYSFFEKKIAKLDPRSQFIKTSRICFRGIRVRGHGVTTGNMLMQIE